MYIPNIPAHRTIYDPMGAIMPRKSNPAAELTIPPAFARAVKARLESGQFESADDMFEVCLELLEREEREYEQKREWLLAALDEGDADIERGRVIDGEEAFARALAEFRRRHRRRAYQDTAPQGT